MLDILINVLSLICAVLMPIIGWFGKILHAKLKEHDRKIDVIDDKIDDHKLYAAENFTTKNDLKDMKEDLVRRLDRIEQKIDGAKA